MIDSQKKHPADSAPWRRAFTLVGALILVGMASIPIAYRTDGTNGLLAAGVAAAIVLLAGMGALAVNEFCRSPEMVIPRVLGSMMLRMGVPLAAAMAIHYRGGPITDAGFIYYLLAFYFVMLVVETIITLPTALHNTPATGETPEAS